MYYNEKKLELKYLKIDWEIIFITKDDLICVVTILLHKMKQTQYIY